MICGHTVRKDGDVILERLRKAEESDIMLLFQWANDPAVRGNSFHSEVIRYEDHEVWFHKMMANPLVHQYIMMAEETPVGQIRITSEDDTAEIGYSIAPEYRGCGYGHKILRLILEEVKKNHPDTKKLIAKVKPENAASNRLFESEQYLLDFLQYSIIVSE